MLSMTIVSVVIPAYNGARFLGEAIQSVLAQTYPHFELIVVDDASTDNTPEIIKQFNDPRIKYILHEKNQGAIAARYTGTLASIGEIIAFLDQDDFYHPEKLQTHVTCYTRHPEIGLTYNPRFDLNNSAKTIRGIFNPPQVLTLADLVLGFPIAPSDMVLRRDWAIREDIWDDSFMTQGKEVIVNGGEYVFLGRLFLAGCKFANVERVLNYRRLQSGRVFSNLALRCRSEIACQEIILSDPRCPSHVSQLRNLAFMNTKLVFAFYAFLQKETNLGQELTREAVHLNPAILGGEPSKFTEIMLSWCIADDNINHVSQLQSILEQLPPELSFLSQQYDRAVAKGYLLKGSRAIIWNRPNLGQTYFKLAAEKKAEVNGAYIRHLVDQLLSYEAEFGVEATQDILSRLRIFLENVGGQSSTRSLDGLFFLNQAFQSYRKGEFNNVPGKVIRAFTTEPRHLTNKGAWAILLRSILKHRTIVSHIGDD
jgi:glycosyltransferase involved in cell wall biosynthesis